MTKIIKELDDSLKKVGAEKIIKRGINEYSVDLDMFDCDRYNYEKETATAQDINSFKGEYMNQYSWAETTLAKLYWKGEYWRRKDPVFRNRDTL